MSRMVAMVLTCLKFLVSTWSTSSLVHPSSEEFLEHESSVVTLQWRSSKAEIGAMSRVCFFSETSEPQVYSKYPWSRGVLSLFAVVERTTRPSDDQF